MLAVLHGAGGGNPSAGHEPGRQARAVVEDARERIAATLDRSPHEVVLTSGGTEADQLAVVGPGLGKGAVVGIRDQDCDAHIR